MTERYPDGEFKTEGECWWLEFYDLSKFRQSMGKEILSAFIAAFVMADRLISLADFMNNQSSFSSDNRADVNRNFQTSFWFTVGTLRELAKSIRRIRAELGKSGYRDFNHTHWIELQEFERRWNSADSFRKMRDRVAFHVDDKVINLGLDRISEEKGPYTIAEGYGSERHCSWFKLGSDCLIFGLYSSDEEQR